METHGHGGAWSWRRMVIDEKDSNSYILIKHFFSSNNTRTSKQYLPRFENIVKKNLALSETAPRGVPTTPGGVVVEKTTSKRERERGIQHTPYGQITTITVVRSYSRGIRRGLRKPVKANNRTNQAEKQKPTSQTPAAPSAKIAWTLDKQKKSGRQKCKHQKPIYRTGPRLPVACFMCGHYLASFRWSSGVHWFWSGKDSGGIEKGCLGEIVLLELLYGLICRLKELQECVWCESNSFFAERRGQSEVNVVCGAEMVKLNRNIANKRGRCVSSKQLNDFYWLKYHRCDSGNQQTFQKYRLCYFILSFCNTVFPAIYWSVPMIVWWVPIDF